jgi:hypothetical protein
MRESKKRESEENSRMRRLIIYTLYQGHYLCDQMKEDEMGRATKTTWGGGGVRN